MKKKILSAVGSFSGWCLQMDSFLHDRALIKVCGCSSKLCLQTILVEQFHPWNSKLPNSSPLKMKCLSFRFGFMRFSNHCTDSVFVIIFETHQCFCHRGCKNNAAKTKTLFLFLFVYKLHLHFSYGMLEM